MSIRSTVYGLPEAGMEKKADGIMSLLPTGGDIMQVVQDAGVLGSTYLIAASMLGGMGLGWTASKLTAHGMRDMDTARKGYENERLKADIGYLSSRIRQERRNADDQYSPKAARIINRNILDA